MGHGNTSIGSHVYRHYCMLLHTRTLLRLSRVPTTRATRPSNYGPPREQPVRRGPTPGPLGPTLCLSDPPRAMPGPAALWYLSICYFISGYSCELGSRALFARTPVRGTARRRGQNPPLPPRLHTTTVTHRPILCERHMSTCHPMPIPDPTLAQSAHVLRGPTDLAVNGRPS